PHASTSGHARDSRMLHAQAVHRRTPRATWLAHLTSRRTLAQAPWRCEGSVGNTTDPLSRSSSTRLLLFHLFHNERERVDDGALANVDAENLSAIICQDLLRFRSFIAKQGAAVGILQVERTIGLYLGVDELDAIDIVSQMD